MTKNIDINDPKCDPKLLWDDFAKHYLIDSDTIAFNEHYIREWYDDLTFEDDDITQQCVLLAEAWVNLGLMKRQYHENDGGVTFTGCWVNPFYFGRGHAN